MDDRISVIMGCYNCENTMRDAIDSILAQTYDNWVMICCDDGSKDKTWEILQEYKDRYPDKFVLLKNDGNKQLPYTLNHCLEYANTKYVARMDADDWSLPDRFEKEIQFLKEHPEIDLVGTAAAVSDGEKRIGSIIKPEYPSKETLLHTNPFSHGSILTYKRVYDQLGGYSLDPNAIRVEDVELWCRFFAEGFKAYNLQEELFIYRENVGAAKRRNVRARINSAITRNKGYRLMGFKGFVCYKPYLQILIAFIPLRIYQFIHERKLKKM